MGTLPLDFASLKICLEAFMVEDFLVKNEINQNRRPILPFYEENQELRKSLTKAYYFSIVEFTHRKNSKRVTCAITKSLQKISLKKLQYNKGKKYNSSAA